ncbi:putative structural protein [Roseobacter phage CRP-1]|nr:putative structural protein [Roseobacter phage CRP-1]
MADNLASFKVFCQGGLNTSRDVLSQGETQPGSAVALINYEPAVTGGYRKINGFSNDYGTVTGTGKVLGVCVANGVNDGILACRAPSSGSNYLHYWNTATSAWVTVTTSGSPTMTGVTKVRFTKYNWGSPKVLLTDGINPAATYDGTTYTQITHADAPSAPKFSHVYKNHMFLAGDPSEDTNLYFSAPYNETSFAAADGAGVINVGFPIVAIKSFRDVLYIFGTNNIRKLAGDNISNFVLQEVTDDLGCLASDSVIEIGGDLLFLSQDGLRPISGTDKIGDVNLETVSKDIQSIFTDIVFDIDLEGLNAVVIRQKTQFRYFFAAADSQGIIGGFRQTPNGLQFEYSQMVGITATCSDSGYIGQNEFVIHGDDNGKVHRQEQGFDFDGDNILSIFQTPFYHMQDPEQRKVFYSVATYLRSEGNNDIVMSILYDYEDVDTLNPTNFNLSTEGAAAYYNEAIYNSTAIFDGNPSPVQRTNISGSGKSASIRYVTNSSDASHSIQGIVITFGVGDRL